MPNEGDLRFNDRWHKYNVYRGGKWISPPSVSKIKGQLDKPALKFWAARVTAEYCVKEVMPLVTSGALKITTEEDFKALFKKAKGWHGEVSAEACAIGTDVHDMLLRYTLTGAIPTSFTTAEAEKSFNAYLKLEKQYDFGEIVATEIPFYNFEHDFCGTFDRLGYVNGKLYVKDYKTSKDFYDLDMAIQLALYKIGIEELIQLDKIPGIKPGTPVEGGAVIRLDKETGFPYYKDYTPWLPLAATIGILLRDALTLTTQFNKISGLTY